VLFWFAIPEFDYTYMRTHEVAFGREKFDYTYIRTYKVFSVGKIWIILTYVRIKLFSVGRNKFIHTYVRTYKIVFSREKLFYTCVAVDSGTELLKGIKSSDNFTKGVYTFVQILELTILRITNKIK